jgi:hypothetical protein
MDTITKTYLNTTSQDIDVIGIGIIAAGELTSITSSVPPAVNLLNYPGLVDISTDSYNSTTDIVTAEKATTEPTITGELING